MSPHVALIAEFQCAEEAYKKATKFPFLSVLREMDDGESFDYQDVSISEVMDGTYDGGIWRLGCDWHEDDWFEADIEKMEAFFVNLAELGASGATMSYQYVNAVSPEIKLWRLRETPMEISINDLAPEVGELLESGNLYDALGALNARRFSNCLFAVFLLAMFSPACRSEGQSTVAPKPAPLGQSIFPIGSGSFGDDDLQYISKIQVENWLFGDLKGAGGRILNFAFEGTSLTLRLGEYFYYNEFPEVRHGTQEKEFRYRPDFSLKTAVMKSQYKDEYSDDGPQRYQQWIGSEGQLRHQEKGPVIATLRCSQMLVPWLASPTELSQGAYTKVCIPKFDGPAFHEKDYAFEVVSRDVDENFGPTATIRIHDLYANEDGRDEDLDLVFAGNGQILSATQGDVEFVSMTKTEAFDALSKKRISMSIAIPTGTPMKWCIRTNNDMGVTSVRWCGSKEEMLAYQADYKTFDLYRASVEIEVIALPSPSFCGNSEENKHLCFYAESECIGHFAECVPKWAPTPPYLALKEAGTSNPGEKRLCLILPDDAEVTSCFRKGEYESFSAARRDALPTPQKIGAPWCFYDQCFKTNAACNNKLAKLGLGPGICSSRWPPMVYSR